MRNASSALFGRANEVGILDKLLDSVGSGFGSTVLLEGEAGVGKTRLLEEALALAKRRGFRVLRGSAREVDSDRPFGILAEALFLDPRADDEERAEIGRGLTRRSPFAGSTPADERYRLVESILSLLERLTAHEALVLALDDLHWADASSLVALDHVRRRLAHVPLAVVGTLRPLPRPRELERLVAEVAGNDVAHVVIGPLSEEAVAALVRDQLGTEPDPALMALVAGARGNPFYVTELVAVLGEEGLLDERNRALEADRAALPPTLRLTILRRLGFLSIQTLELLRVASILGSTFPVTDLSTVLGRPPAELLSALDEALRAGVLAEAGERMAFRHDLVREAVYEDIPIAIRRALHTDAGRRLAGAGASPVHVATHFASAATPGDREAVEWLRRAAREVGAQDPTIAARLLEKAHDLLPPKDEARNELLAELAWWLLWSGKLEETVGLSRRLLAARPDPRVAGTLHYALAKALVSQGRVAESLRELEVGLSVEGLPEEDRLRLLADLALRRFHARDIPGAREAAERALREAEAAGAPFPACAARCALAMIALYGGRVPQAVEEAEATVALADADLTGELLLVGPRLYLGLALIQADGLDKAVGVLHAARGEEGQAFQSVWPGVAALAHYHAGRWDDAVAEAETSLALAEETGSRVFDLLVSGTLAQVAFHRNDLRAAERALTAAEEELRDSGLARMGLAWVQWARAFVKEARGDALDALHLLDGVWELGVAREMPAECSELTPDLVRLAISAGWQLRAAEVAETMEGLAEHMRTPSARGRALRCRGILEREPDALLEAVRALRSGRRPLELAAACEDAARLLRFAGRDAEAIDLLREAAEQYIGLTASRDAARVDAELRSLGVRPGRRGPRRRPTTGWESLTPTELEVVRLAAEGLTNGEIGRRLFISPRTVSTHLTHVFGKLGVSTRVQLAAEVARRGS